MKQYPGVVTAIVKSLEDPDGEGKIKLDFPWMSPDGQKSAWAPVASLMAGKDRGAFFMPEPEDEVLVAFEQGDFNHPFIVGFLWNGADKPPQSDINSSVRRLKTVSGHTIDFDDNGGKERILIKTAQGHEIEMKDATPGSITIKTKGGQEVKLDDLPSGITLSVPTGTLKIDCMNADVTASSLLNVSAPMTVFSGVVQVPTLIAQSVVSSAYTPAPGNTYGL
jgi:uncharacterized protein involved in type VI secretion and phage assembly